MTQQAVLDDPSLTDHALLCAGVDDQRIEQAAEFRRVRRWAELTGRWSADVGTRRAEQPHFTLAPLAELVVEAGPLSGFSEGRIRGDVAAVECLAADLPQLLAWGLEGRIDLYRARVVTDAIMIGLAEDPELVPVFATKMTEWFAAHLAALETHADEAHADEAHADGLPVLIVKTREQIQRKVAYLLRALRTTRANEEFRRAFADRRVDKRVGDDGMGEITLTHDAVTITAINRHLDLLARDARRKGDPRTRAQLRADFAADLLLGRITITEHGEIVEHETGRWARPVINVTVPLATLAGASDQPGVLNGATHLPAGLVRAVATDPTSTWHRLVTDPLRGIVELSTQGYRPTDPLWREVVARWGTCYGPTCDIPATETEIDHNQPYPHGPTTTSNLAPACSRHHPAKHTHGASISIDAHGTRRWRTRAGFTHLLEPDHLHLPPRAHLGDGHDGYDGYGGDIGGHIDLDAWQLHRDAELFDDYRDAYPNLSDEAIEDWLTNGPCDPALLR